MVLTRDSGRHHSPIASRTHVISWIHSCIYVCVCICGCLSVYTCVCAMRACEGESAREGWGGSLWEGGGTSAKDGKNNSCGEIGCEPQNSQKN